MGKNGMIRFNEPFTFGEELKYVNEAIEAARLSGNGAFTKKCHSFFEDTFGFGKCLLTTSCTDALEMAAILMDIEPGDEVIIPSYTFVSSANAFVLRGARIVFADSEPDHPNLDASALESLITERTKAIVVVHYGGIACDMEAVLDLAGRHDLFVVEDAAQAIDSTYNGLPLGSFGHFAAFSFHETKNVVSGEGGMLVVNEEKFEKRAEIIWEKGTNRTAFFRGEVDKYGWVDIGSSFLPSDLIAAYLWGQLGHLKEITEKRVSVWDQYYDSFERLERDGFVKRPKFPDYATNNGHVFYLECKSLEERSSLIDYLKERGVGAVFHYLSLHKSPFYTNRHDGRELPNADRFAETLIRFPLHLHLDKKDISHIVQVTLDFFREIENEPYEFKF